METLQPKHPFWNPWKILLAIIAVVVLIILSGAISIYYFDKPLWEYLGNIGGTSIDESSLGVAMTELGLLAIFCTYTLFSWLVKYPHDFGDLKEVERLEIIKRFWKDDKNRIIAVTVILLLYYFLGRAPYLVHKNDLAQMSKNESNYLDHISAINVSFSNQVSTLNSSINGLKNETNENSDELYFLKLFVNETPATNYATIWTRIYDKIGDDYLSGDWAGSIRCYRMCTNYSWLSSQGAHWVETQTGPLYYFDILRMNQARHSPKYPDRDAINQFEGELNDLTNCFFDSENAGPKNDAFQSSIPLNQCILQLQSVEDSLHELTNNAPPEVRGLPEFVIQIEKSVQASMKRAVARGE